MLTSTCTSALEPLTVVGEVYKTVKRLIVAVTAVVSTVYCNVPLFASPVKNCAYKKALDGTVVPIRRGCH